MSRRTLVTSALPYANGPVHIGHLAGAYLPADIYVRYLRARGETVRFICGSDEHGVPITLTARQEGIDPQDVIDRYHPANEQAFARAGMSFDIYGRTSWPLNHEFTQRFFRKLHAGGHIVKKPIRQFYSEFSGMFLPDRYVMGECPHCGYEDARGDQCESCGRTYEADQLKNPRANLPGDSHRPELRETVHWFLKLGDFERALSDWLDRHQDWRGNVLNTAREWLRQGLRERCITRDTDWGVKIPLDDPDIEGKRIYVWFDAPIGYVTNTAALSQGSGDQSPESENPKPETRNSKPERSEWWQDSDTRLIHFIGKDNIPFHAIFFPAMLLGQGDYILPDQVVANEFLNFKGRKLSKSRPGDKVGVADFLEVFPADPLRYYLTAIAPEGRDTDFFWEDFQQRTNSDLADTLGNFVNRGFKFAERYFENRVPELVEPGAEDRKILFAAAVTSDEVGERLGAFRIKAALERVMEFARACNGYIDRAAPWKARKSDPASAARTIRVCLELNAALAGLVRPFLPHSAGVLAEAFGPAGTPAPVQGTDGYWDQIGLAPLEPGAALGSAAVLFEKIDDERLAAAVRHIEGR